MTPTTSAPGPGKSKESAKRTRQRASLSSRSLLRSPRQARQRQAATGSELPATDRKRLRAATGTNRVDPTRSLFGPESVTWRVNREAVLLLGGGRALLMQLAHPLVAAGVADHTRFHEEPLRRLWQTLHLTLTIVFGSAADAIRAVRAIEKVHERVNGTLTADVGPFPRGTRYDANDPALLFWVHATLVDSALTVFEQFVERLSPSSRQRYYEESKATARLFGIPERFIPRTFGEFQDYMRHMIRGNTLAVGNDARHLAAAILSPPLAPGLKQLFELSGLFTIGLLPPSLRARYGYGWSATQERLLRGIQSTTSTVLPVLPRWMRTIPHGRVRQSV